MGQSACTCDWPLARSDQSEVREGHAAAAGQVPARLQGRADGGGGAAPILESEADKVPAGHEGRSDEQPSPPEVVVDELVVVPCRCGSRLCEQCGSILGRTVRKRLHEKAGLFPAPRMITLTVDLKGTLTGRPFASAEEAFRYVTDGKLIPKLMAKLGRKYWVRVLEFQANGAPHWHIVMDCSDLVGSEFSYDLVTKWWLRVWKVGLWRASGKSEGFASPSHAMNYVSKYLIKQPECGYPAWAWEMLRKELRFVGASKAVGSLVRSSGSGDSQAELEEAMLADEVEQGDQADQGDQAVTNRQRVQSCGAAVKVLRHVVRADGSERWHWVGGLLERLELVVVAAAAGLVRGVHFSAAGEVGEQGTGGGGRMRVMLEGWSSVTDLERDLRRLRAYGAEEILARASARGFTFNEDGSWVYDPSRRAAS